MIYIYIYIYIIYIYNDIYTLLNGKPLEAHAHTHDNPGSRVKCYDAIAIESNTSRTRMM